MSNVVPMNGDLAYLLKYISAYRIAKCLDISPNTIVMWKRRVWSPLPRNTANLAHLRVYMERHQSYEGFTLPNHKSAMSVR